MNLAEKQFLTKDICSRLNYSLKCKVAILDSKELYTIIDIDLGQYPDMVMVRVENSRGSRIECPIEEVKPYLRPMSSMTEEEYKEFKACHCVYDLDYDFQPMMCTVTNECNMFDWLDKNYFDYRGLIPKGLAIATTNGDYPYEEKQTIPDKIYLKPRLTEEGDSIVRRCTIEKLNDNQIEYIRKDAFIEKAVEHIDGLIEFLNEYGHQLNKERIIRDFKNYLN